MNPGILIVSGDCVTTYSQLKIPKMVSNTAISIKVDLEVGKRHGVFVIENEILVKTMQKSSIEELEKIADENGKVNLDTGMVYLNDEMIRKMQKITIDEGIRINFYTDLMYPLAKKATLEEYLNLKAEVIELNEKVVNTRKRIWNILKDENMKVLQLEQGEFIHYGTTEEFLREALKHDLGDGGKNHE